MKILISAILIIILLILMAQIYFILKERNQMRDKLWNLSVKAEILNEDNSKIKSEIEYFSRPENLEKEIRSQFNVKKPGEKMIIVTP